VERNPINTAKLRHPGGFVIAIILLTSATLVTGFPSSSQATPTTETQSFYCAGYADSFVVPADVYNISFDMYGSSDGWTSSYGARVTGTVRVTPGEELEIKVGCKGSVTHGTGGFPDGGRGGGIQQNNAASGGGGSTSIVADPNTSYEVLAIAGGGGGSTNFTIGGAGGMTGDDAPPGWVDMRFMDGKGATQSEGGGQTCNLANFCEGAGSYLQGGESVYGGGGGGGYYGGGAGTGDINYWWENSYSDYSTAGGGGSSYVSPTRSNGFVDPQYFTGWSDRAGSLVISWTATATTTSTAPTTTAVATTTIASTTTVASTTTAVSTTTLPTSTIATTTSVVTTPSTVVVATPSWVSLPETESEMPVIGLTPFPASGSGTVQVTDETGFIVTKARAFIPKWRTRVYIGDFKFSLKATYLVNKKKKTFSCSIPVFGTQKIQKTSSIWRWYQPAKGCVLPKDLVTQLAQRKTTMTLTGTFARKWATSGKTIRPDKSKITTRRINLRIGAADTVTLS
jgi:hypothetical protein